MRFRDHRDILGDAPNRVDLQGRFMPRRRPSAERPPDAADPRRLRIAPEDPAVAARALAALLPSAIDKAESLGLATVSEHLTMALTLIARRAEMAEPKS